MAKDKKVFICSNCGANSVKWIGNCPSCGEWNTYQEEIVIKDSKKKASWQENTEIRVKPVYLNQIQKGQTNRFSSGDAELDRVLGGGIVQGSLVLLGGQPGIGKSTLLLQLALNSSVPVLYVSGEESEEQIKIRADRLGGNSANCLIYTETNIDVLLKTANSLEVAFIIIDSIQTVHNPNIDSSPGSITQVRESTHQLMKYAKTNNVPILIIGHINKEGSIAGPKLLEHMVDTVLLFEGDQHHSFRIIRTQKNRFGSTDELAIYEMKKDGLAQVSNPSEMLLSPIDEDMSGSCVAATLEGGRTILIEIQALVSTAIYGTPQRSVTGFDLRRLNMLLAVLEKRAGFPIGQFDVFLNVAGGIQLKDPAADLSITAALVSSMEDISVPRDYCFAGEVGLSGEIRGVANIELRISEADKLGFKKIFVPKSNIKSVSKNRFGIEIVPIEKLEELLNELFG